MFSAPLQSLCLLHSLGEVGLEGSPQMIFRHYRELVRPIDAEKWFGVTPGSVEAAKAARESGAKGKIVKLPGVKAAWQG